MAADDVDVDGDVDVDDDDDCFLNFGSTRISSILYWSNRIFVDLFVLDPNAGCRYQCQYLAYLNVVYLTNAMPKELFTFSFRKQDRTI